MLAASCAAPTIPPTPLVHAIDSSVWLAKGAIDWPGPDHRVYAYFDADGSFAICGKELTAAAREAFATSSDFLWGEACGHFIVLFRPAPIALDATAREMLAAHEAFHLAAQMHGLLPRIDAAEFPGHPDAGAWSNINTFFREVFRLSALRGKHKPCDGLEDAYRALPPFERDYVVYKTYWEWPAEFYMRETARGETMSAAEYRALRTSLIVNGLDEIVYLAGERAMNLVELAIGREAWQRRYLDGEHMLNFFAESLGCPPLLGPTLQVDSITEEAIFTDVQP